jgi:hypothetical protein
MTPRHTRLIIARFIAFITLTLSAQSLLAVEGNTSDKDPVTWYQVEILLFKNNKDYKQDQNDTALNLPSSEQEYVLIKGDPMVENQLKRLPNSSLKLNKSFKAITRSKDFEVLEFAGWKQPLTKDKTGIPINIRAGEKFGGHYELEGQLTFRKNRYLHVKSDLYMANYEEGTQANIQEWLLQNEFSAASFSSLTETTNIKHEASTDSTEIIADTKEVQEAQEEDIPLNFIATHVAHMNESRRMRSGEIHYLDHPKFGVLVTIEPTDPPFVYNEPSN